MNKVENNILILGEGYIGTRLSEGLNCQITGEKIYSFKDAKNLISKFNPKIIINCMGHVGSNVDECERDIDKTLFTNSYLPVVIGEVALRKNILLVHISSGCIFHYDYAKDPPLDETKEPDFFELFYSRTKIYSDHALRDLSKKYPVLIVRIRVPLDNRPHPRNILTKLINYKKIIDLPNSVTYIPDFVLALRHLININATGVYNVVSKDPLSYPKLMAIYKSYAPSFNYHVIDFKTLNTVRTNLVLSTQKLEKSGFKVRNINDVMEECVREYVKYE